MLFNLSIENIALIERIDINFGDGFNVLTGETGAGKSILIHSVNMLLGQRISREMIRNGENSACVEGLFYISPETAKLLEKFDVTADEEGCLILSRQIFADGKNICKAGGKIIPVASLKEIGNILVNVHGQHDNQALLDSNRHLEFLDAFLTDEEHQSILEYHDLYHTLKEKERELASLDIDENEKMRRMDLLRFEIDEITQAALTVGEEEDLKIKRSIVKNRALIEENCASTLRFLYENDESVSAYHLLSQAQNAIDVVADATDRLREISNKISDLRFTLEDVVGELHECSAQSLDDFVSLDEIEERLDQIYRLKRKYGNSEAEVIAYCENAENELVAIQSVETRKDELKADILKLRNRTETLAQKNHQLRLLASEEITKKINQELAELSMERAEFSVHIEEIPLGKNGIDSVEFMLSTNRGEPMKPLTKIISGGELSRIMLALKNVLSAGDSVETLIFDEIDSGISGRVAGKVGLKMYEIAQKKQVLCVTHLPQIASLSQHHFKISKTEERDKTNTKVSRLNAQEKVSEIAFMIGGDSVTSTTIAQAEEMIRFAGAKE